ncbi:MAG: hypothetical protein ACM3SM_08880 [Bacteroidota bacterium]
MENLLLKYCILLSLLFGLSSCEKTVAPSDTDSIVLARVTDRGAVVPDALQYVTSVYASGKIEYTEITSDSKKTKSCRTANLSMNDLNSIRESITANHLTGQGNIIPETFTGCTGSQGIEVTVAGNAEDVQNTFIIAGSLRCCEEKIPENVRTFLGTMENLRVQYIR